MSAPNWRWDAGTREAYLAAAVRAEAMASIEEIEGWLAALGDEGELNGQRLPNHRLNALIASIAWHATRQSDEQRVAALEIELRRLVLRAGGATTPEGRLYTLLAARIGLGLPPGAQEDRLLRSDPPPAAEQEHWRVRARLLLAQALLGVCVALVRGQPLLAELERMGRNNVWP